jgi:hypothetical protein
LNHMQSAVVGQAPPAPLAHVPTVFTCPMHPQVRHDGPGSCPICGMSLEPVFSPEIPAPNPDLDDMTLRLKVALALTAPLFIPEMGQHFLAITLPIGHQAQAWVELALATPVVVWAGFPFFQRAWASLRAGHASMFTLVALGVSMAWLYSAVAMLAPGFMPMADGHAPLYFESAAVITVLVLLGQVLELRARAQTSGALVALMHLAPTSGRRVRGDGVDEDVALDLIQVGDLLRVRPGEKIPVDGQVTEGHVSVYESLVTGESMPVTKQPGDKVVAGALNLTGVFVMRAEKNGADTLLAQDGERGPAQPRAHPTARRSGRGLVRAGGDRRRHGHLRGLDGAWLGTAPRSRPGRGSVSLDHRLPLHAWAGDADIDHGGRGPWRKGGRVDP